MPSKLPQELVNHVANFSHGDKKILASASRVSRTCLIAFQKLLFETIRIDTRAVGEFEEVLGFLEKSAAICPLIIHLRLGGDIDACVLANILSYLPRLSTLIFAGNFSAPSGSFPSFAPLHLDSLSICWQRNFQFSDAERSYNSEDEGDEEIPERLQNLLTEHGVTWEQFLDGEVPEGFELDYQDMSDDEDGEDAPETPVPDEQFREDAQILANVLGLFSQVRKFWFQYLLERNIWNLTHSDLQEIIPTPGALRVESFCLDTDRSTDSMIGFFRRLVHRQVLSSVAISADWYPHFEEFRSLVRETSNLSSLSFRVAECLTDVPPNHGLKECPSLRSLLIHPEYATTRDETEPELESDYDSGHRAIFGWRAIELVLLQRLSQIQHITIEIHRYPLAPHHILQSLGYIQWAQLQILILDHYPNHKTLNFSFQLKKQYRDRGVSYEGLRAHILQNLPHLAARNMVEFKKMEVFHNELSWSYNQLPSWMQ